MNSQEFSVSAVLQNRKCDPNSCEFGNESGGTNQENSWRDQPYDFLVQSPTWKLGPVSTAILRQQFDKTYVTVSFANHGRAITLNFIVVNGPDGWVISDVESPHDSLRMFLDQFRR